MNFELITGPQQLIALGWDAFVRSHPQETVFQSPEMHELFMGSSRMKPVMIAVVEKETQLLKGVLAGVNIRELKGPAGYFSSRTVVYGGPLIDAAAENRNKIVLLLLDGLISQVKGHSIFIQFRNFRDQEEFRDIFAQRGFNYRDRLNLIVDTSSREAVIKNMSTSRWRQIRKGLGLLDSWTVGQLDNRHPEQREGTPRAEIIEPENTGQVREFFNILSDLYRYKVKKPLPAWDFFERFYNLSKDGKVGIIRLVKYREKIIGGILSPVTPGKTIYEWYVCGLDHEYKEVYPSVLATWAAIDYALKNGIPQFDFMGVGLPDREYGVREFKSRFGGEMVNYGRFARINNKAVYMISEIGFNILTLLKRI